MDKWKIFSAKKKNRNYYFRYCCCCSISSNQHVFLRIAKIFSSRSRLDFFFIIIIIRDILWLGILIQKKLYFLCEPFFVSLLGNHKKIPDMIFSIFLNSIFLCYSFQQNKREIKKQLFLKLWKYELNASTD